MNEKLAGYEIITAILGKYFEKKNTKEIHLKNRVKLYETVHKLYQAHPEKVGVFYFRKRRGRYTSDDVDIVLRNLEDSEFLECLNPELVVFRAKDAFYQYLPEINLKITKIGLETEINEAANNL